MKPSMKIAVMNFSGNVGKTTVSRHLLAPRIEEAEVMSIESINSDGTEEETLRGEEYGALLRFLLMQDSAIVDVGASNVEDFVAYMQEHEGSHQEFDYFILPVVPKDKQIADTLATISSLHDLGVDASKIRVVFNMVEKHKSPEVSFSPVFEFYKSKKVFTLRPEAKMMATDLYEKLKEFKKTIAEVNQDNTDYKKALKESSSEEEKMFCAAMVALKYQASGISKELDKAFEALFS